MTAPTTRETAGHAELKRLAEAADQPMPPKRRAGWWGRKSRFEAAFTPAVCSALLSEIAALRGERDRLKLAICGGEDVSGAIDAVTVDDCEGFIREERHRHDGLLTQAERQRDELRKALGDVLHIFPSQKPRASDESEPQAIRTARALIANQGADQ